MADIVGGAAPSTPAFSGRAYGTTIAVFGVLIIASLGYLARSEIMKWETWIWIAILAVIFSIFFGTATYFASLMVRKVYHNVRSGADKVEKLAASSEVLQGALEQDFVTNLVRINFKYIDAYYLQTRIQADKSFTFTVVAAMVSLVLIVIGIGFSFFDNTKAVAVSGGAGVLGQFISAVFFYLYNQTVAKMADYHRKLVFTQNIGLALKISDGLPADEKTKAQCALIDTLSKNINEYLGH